MFHPFSKSAVRLAVLSLIAAQNAAVFAQAPTPQLKEITITGNSLGATDLIAPSGQYSGEALLFRSKTTLGETLDGTPGVSSTYFGPNASRPIIRGQDGDRIRILNNGGALLDVSGLSYDHAVAADPLSTERIEVLRGPGALQYGGSAVGGVVNVIDNRIPREALFDAKGGVGGKVDLGLATGNKERGAGVLLEAGNNRYAIHIDAMNRETGDVKIPVDFFAIRQVVLLPRAAFAIQPARSAAQRWAALCSLIKGTLGHPSVATAAITARWLRLMSILA